MRKELRLLLHSSLETCSAALTAKEVATWFMCVCRMEICFLLCSVSQCFICHSSSWTYTGTTQRASGCSPGISIILLICGINMFYLQINLKKKDSSSFWIIYTTDKKQFYVLKIVGGVLIVSLAEIKTLQWLQNHRLSRSPGFMQTGVKKKKKEREDL